MALIMVFLLSAVIGSVTAQDDCIGNPCGEYGTCIDGVGTFTCECMDGFSQSTSMGICEDIDECLNTPCGDFEDCVNTPGSVMCLCTDGYTRNTTTGACVGMNECENEGLCGPYGECVDMLGGYYCECQDGYYYHAATGRCETLSVVLGLPRIYPAKVVQGRGVCYSQDTTQDRMDIEEETRQILQEFADELANDSPDGGGNE